VATDVLRWPVIGAFLKWRHARTVIQLVLLVLAGVLVVHGLVGPQFASTNLATLLIWVHYRGLLVIALLAAGNLFCTGCPFVLVRDVGRRLRSPVRHWPRRWRTKWVALALFVAVLFAYELFDLWSLPRATAWLVLTYFAAALAVDLTFSGATFCKYLCPIGQFNFIASTMSPLELSVRSESTCRSCRTADCIKGRSEPALRGCELGLFLPLKVGNMDCTLCLDCVHACPHDNIALTTRVPGLELVDPRRRSGIGRFARRPDLAALAILFTFGGMLNAFAMVSPVYALEGGLSQALGVRSEAPILAILFVVALGVAPLMLVGGAAALTSTIVGRGSIGGVAVSYAYALVPLGFAMWLAHYSFHLVTGVFTVIPVTQAAALDLLGWSALGAPLWRLAGLRPGLIYPIQLGCLLLGAMGSLAAAYGISDREYPDRRGWATVPWAMVTMALVGAAIWIVSQPMEMRGLGFLG
jgi:ferredoxin